MHLELCLKCQDLSHNTANAIFSLAKRFFENNLEDQFMELFQKSITSKAR